MKDVEETKEQFLKDVADHKVEILRDDGIYRHLKCSTGSQVYRFDIITWPGHLTICQDMGTYVFSRTPDMFQFFRQEDEELKVNRSYWAEKILAECVRGSVERYSEERFNEVVRHEFNNHFEDNDFDEDLKQECWENLKRFVLSAENEHEAYQKTMDFEHKPTKFSFDDFWEHDLKEYTHHYTWCLFAIVWAIREYDKQIMEGRG